MFHTKDSDIQTVIQLQTKGFIQKVEVLLK